MARRLGVTPSAVTQACRPGGPLEPACVQKKINVLHEAAQSWLARRVEQAPIDVDTVTPDDDTAETALAKGTHTVSTPSEAATETEAPWQAVDLERLEEPLRTLTLVYGDAPQMAPWIQQRKHLAAARKEEMLQARVAGRLIARTTVERLIQKVDDAFRLMLTDAPRTIATQIAPTDMARCSAVARDAMEQILTKCKDQMVMSLRADNPLASLEEAAE